MASSEAFLQFCQDELRLPPELQERATACFTKVQEAAPVASNGSGSLGGKPLDKKRVLYGCCVYIAKKLEQKEKNSVFPDLSLSKILSVVRVSLVDFLAEIRNCIAYPDIIPDENENGM